LVTLAACNRSSDAATNADPAATVLASAAPAPSRPPEPSRIPAVAALATTSQGGRASGSATSRASHAAAPHPLEDWMRGPATEAFLSGDLEVIARSFEQMGAWAPATDYPNWKSICTDGAEAARFGSVEGVKAACRGCHVQYEKEYKQGLATRPLP
jgi:hypothetical protein